MVVHGWSGRVVQRAHGVAGGRGGGVRRAAGEHRHGTPRGRRGYAPDLREREELGTETSNYLEDSMY